MNPGQTPETFNQEIAELEAKLAAKKQELMKAGVESPEQAVFKQVVREHVTPSEQATPMAPASAAPTNTNQTARTITAEETQKLNVFIAHAFTKGLSSALAEAKKTGDAFFVDMLHDRLADEYYQKLLAARKINAS